MGTLLSTRGYGERHVYSSVQGGKGAIHRTRKTPTTSGIVLSNGGLPSSKIVKERMNQEDRGNGDQQSMRVFCSSKSSGNCLNCLYLYRCMYAPFAKIKYSKRPKGTDKEDTQGTARYLSLLFAMGKHKGKGKETRNKL